MKSLIAQLNVKIEILTQNATQISIFIDNWENELKKLKNDILGNTNRVMTVSTNINEFKTMANNFTESFGIISNQMSYISNFISNGIDAGILSSEEEEEAQSSIPEEQPVIITVPSSSNIKKYNGASLLIVNVLLIAKNSILC